MSNKKACKDAMVFGLDGKLLDLTNLPSSQPIRWVMRRKVEVVAAVQGGLLSIEDACERYAISTEEFLAWTSAMERFGPEGLRITPIPRFRTRVRASAHRHVRRAIGLM